MRLREGWTWLLDNRWIIFLWKASLKVCFGLDPEDQEPSESKWGDPCLYPFSQASEVRVRPEHVLCPFLVGRGIENGCTSLSHQRWLHSSDEAELRFWKMTLRRWWFPVHPWLSLMVPPFPCGSLSYVLAHSSLKQSQKTWWSESYRCLVKAHQTLPKKKKKKVTFFDCLFWNRH